MTIEKLLKSKKYRKIERSGKIVFEKIKGTMIMGVAINNNEEIVDFYIYPRAFKITTRKDVEQINERWLELMKDVKECANV